MQQQYASTDDKKYDIMVLNRDLKQQPLMNNGSTNGHSQQPVVYTQVQLAPNISKQMNQLSATTQLSNGPNSQLLVNHQQISRQQQQQYQSNPQVSNKLNNPISNQDAKTALYEDALFSDENMAIGDYDEEGGAFGGNIDQRDLVMAELREHNMAIREANQNNDKKLVQYPSNFNETDIMISATSAAVANDNEVLMQNHSQRARMKKNFTLGQVTSQGAAEGAANPFLSPQGSDLMESRKSLAPSSGRFENHLLASSGAINLASSPTQQQQKQQIINQQANLIQKQQQQNARQQQEMKNAQRTANQQAIYQRAIQQNVFQQQDSQEDSEFDLCFVVEEIEFLTFKEGFVRHSPYLRQLLDSLTLGQTANSETPQVRVLLPLWATAKSFRVLLDFVNSQAASMSWSDLQIADADLKNIQNVLWLADFFQILPLQRLCIEKHIEPKLDAETVIPFLEDSFAKLASCQDQMQESQQALVDSNDHYALMNINYLTQCEDMWYSFFSRCIDISSQNIDILIKTKERELISLPETILEEIMERAFKNLQTSSLLNRCGSVSQNIGSRLSTGSIGQINQAKAGGLNTANPANLETIVKFLMRARGCLSVFDILTQEKDRAIALYQRQNILPSNESQSQHQGPSDSYDQTPKPLLTWKLANLNLRQNFYRESDVFATQAPDVSQNNGRKENVPQDINSLKWRLLISKTNNKECNVGVKCIFPEGSHSLMNKIISLLCWVKISSSRESAPTIESHYQVDFAHLLLSPDRSQTLLRTLPLFLIHQANQYSTPVSSTSASLNVEVYFQINHTVASLLTYIRDNFGLLTEPRVPIGEKKQLSASPCANLTSAEMSMLLSDKNLKVKSEDEVVDALAQWLFVNLPNTDERTLVEELMKQVNWPYVSFERMLELYRAFAELRSNIHTKGIFHNQFKYRATKIGTPNDLPPPRAGYDSLMIETMFDYHYFLDKVAEYIIKSFDQPNLNTTMQESNIQSRSFIESINNRQVTQSNNEATPGRENPAHYISDNQLSSQKKKKHKKNLQPISIIDATDVQQITGGPPNTVKVSTSSHQQQQIRGTPKSTKSASQQNSKPASATALPSTKGRGTNPASHSFIVNDSQNKHLLNQCAKGNEKVQVFKSGQKQRSGGRPMILDSRQHYQQKPQINNFNEPVSQGGNMILSPQSNKSSTTTPVKAVNNSKAKQTSKMGVLKRQSIKSAALGQSLFTNDPLNQHANRHVRGAHLIGGTVDSQGMPLGAYSTNDIQPMHSQSQLECSALATAAAAELEGYIIPENVNSKNRGINDDQVKLNKQSQNDNSGQRQIDARQKNKHALQYEEEIKDVMILDYLPQRAKKGNSQQRKKDDKMKQRALQQDETTPDKYLQSYDILQPHNSSIHQQEPTPDHKSTIKQNNRLQMFDDYGHEYDEDTRIKHEEPGEIHDLYNEQVTLDYNVGRKVNRAQNEGNTSDNEDENDQSNPLMVVVDDEGDSEVDSNADDMGDAPSGISQNLIERYTGASSYHQENNPTDNNEDPAFERVESIGQSQHRQRGISQHTKQHSLPPSMFDIIPASAGGVFNTSHQPQTHFSQRRPSGMKFMGELNHSFAVSGMFSQQ